MIRRSETRKCYFSTPFQHYSPLHSAIYPVPPMASSVLCLVVRAYNLSIGYLVRDWNSPLGVPLYSFALLSMSWLCHMIFFFFLRMKCIHLVNIYWAPIGSSTFARWWTKIARDPFWPLLSLEFARQINLALLCLTHHIYQEPAWISFPWCLSGHVLSFRTLITTHLLSITFQNYSFSLNHSTSHLLFPWELLNRVIRFIRYLQ